MFGSWWVVVYPLCIFIWIFFFWRLAILDLSSSPSWAEPPSDSGPLPAAWESEESTLLILNYKYVLNSKQRSHPISSVCRQSWEKMCLSVEIAKLLREKCFLPERNKKLVHFTPVLKAFPPDSIRDAKCCTGITLWVEIHRVREHSTGVWQAEDHFPYLWSTPQPRIMLNSFSKSLHPFQLFHTRSCSHLHI